MANNKTRKQNTLLKLEEKIETLRKDMKGSTSYEQKLKLIDELEILLDEKMRLLVDLMENKTLKNILRKDLIELDKRLDSGE